MATKVLMEALSPTMEEGQIAKWIKQEGDEIRSGETLAEVETDKAIMELVARGDGVLRKIFVGAGETVDVGSLVGVIAAADEDISSFSGGATPKSSEPEASSTAAAVTPTSATPPPLAAATVEPTSHGTPGERVKASPLARRMASERGLNLSAVKGTGPGGRIVKRDVESAPATGVPFLAARGGGYEDVPLTQIRKTIARRLSESVGPIPHFFLTAEIDMERAADMRIQLNELESEPRISFNDIVLKAVASALMQHRDCNAWWQDTFIRYFNEVHIGVAVAVDDGLITPVVRNTELKTLRQIAAEVRELAGRAREKRLSPEEYTGSTFSVSNLGMFDIDQFTGIINPPEAGLLAVGGITEKPVVINGEIVVRKRMRITMSCDHRIIDGAMGAAFLKTLRHTLENPLMLVL